MNGRLSLAELMLQFRIRSPLVILPDEVWAIAFLQACRLERITDEVMKEIEDFLRR